MIEDWRRKKGEDVDKEIKDLLLKNPHLKALQGALTAKGKQELTKKWHTKEYSKSSEKK